jgi:FkbM family methyltransferase
MNRKVLSYWAELWFAYRVCATWASFFRLVVETALFHVGNLIRLRPTLAQSSAFPVALRLPNLSTTVWLRRSSGDLFIFYEILLHRVYCLPTEGEGSGQVAEILDCGGNIGITALYFASRYPNARIISVEPLPDNLALLQKNAAGVRRILPLWGCISDADGERFLSTDRPAWGNAITDDAGGCKVPSYSIDTILKRYNIDVLDILKVDIEGAEEQVFAARADFLRKTRLVVIELHGDYTLDRFQADLSRYDFVASNPGDPPATRCITARPSSSADVGQVLPKGPTIALLPVP